MADTQSTLMSKDIEEGKLLGGGHIYSPTEALLPKYQIGAGRNGAEGEVNLSLARLFITKGATERVSILKNAFGSGFNEFKDEKPYVGFLLTSASENRVERVQATPLQGDNFVSTFYGEQPRTYAYGGILYNTSTARWRDIFDILYENVFRGSKVTETRALVQLMYDQRVVTGWMTNLTQNLDSSNESMAQFSFNMLVRRVDIVTPMKDITKNNAYFIGSMSEREKELSNQGLANIPVDSSYTRKARTRPPPKPKISTGGGRGPCRILPVYKTRNSESTKIAPTQRRGATGPGTATKSPCDIAEALVQAKKRVERENKIIERIGKKTNKSKKDTATLAAAQKRRRAAQAEIVRGIGAVKDQKSSLSDEVRARARATLGGAIILSVTPQEYSTNKAKPLGSSSMRTRLKHYEKTRKATEAAASAAAAAEGRTVENTIKREPQPDGLPSPEYNYRERKYNHPFWDRNLEPPKGAFEGLPEIEWD